MIKTITLEAIYTSDSIESIKGMRAFICDRKEADY